jgi:hypothetical protein
MKKTRKQLKRSDDNGEGKLYAEDEPRFYTRQQLIDAGYKNPRHEEVPSVTTIISAKRKGIGFDIWLGNQPSYKAAAKYRDYRARIGLAVHKSIAELLLKRRTRAGRGCKMFLLNFKTFAKDYKLEADQVEKVIYNSIRGYAGTKDFRGWVTPPGEKRIKVIIDWKTTKSKQPLSHKPQASAYWEAERAGVQEIWIVYFKRQKKFLRGQITRISVAEAKYHFDCGFMPCVGCWKYDHPNRIKIRRTKRGGRMTHISSIMLKAPIKKTNKKRR